MPNIEKDSFVAVSDLHSTPWTLKKIKEDYLNKFDKIFILGDVTDRGINSNGEKGLQMLRVIKKLTELYPNRVIYIPGNHDYFLLNYFFTKDELKMNYRAMQIRNGGYCTYVDIENLKRENEKEYLELISWLGKQPIQYIHEYNNQKYAFAHALFDMDAYECNPNANLVDYMNDERLYANVLWYRKLSNYTYESGDMPDSSYKMIVGHTPAFIRENVDMDVIGSDGKIVEVNCIDNGVFLENRPLGVYDCYLGNCYTRDFEDKNHKIRNYNPIKSKTFTRIKRKLNKDDL